jgi:hypothetical protein
LSQLTDQDIVIDTMMDYPPLEDYIPSVERRKEELPTLDDMSEFPLSHSAAPLKSDNGTHENQHSLPNPE